MVSSKLGALLCTQMSKGGDGLASLISHCKEYGYIFNNSDIYDGLSAVYDYGPYGAELKKNVKDYWWKAMVQLHEDIVGIDSAIFLHPTVWKASGHIDSFSDPLVDNKDTKKRYRADQLIEGFIAKLEKKRKHDKATALKERYAECEAAADWKGLSKLIVEYEIGDPESGSKNWSEVREFNLMFSTALGSVAENAQEIYLRPETAQGIFINFLNVQKSARMKLPFGIAQIGKAFRNEIVARQFIFRMREFEQMEMQWFVKPGSEIEAYQYWKEKRMRWHLSLGTDQTKYRFHEHTKLAHYANAAVDIEYEFPFGFKELEGIHSRTDFDLKQHQQYSGKKLQYYDVDMKDSYVPYVVETSIGVDRMVLALLSNALVVEQLQNDGKQNERTVMKLPPLLAPVGVAVLPLLAKEGMPERAEAILKELKLSYNCQLDVKDAIGRRYRRQDAIGTPFCITVDHQTLEDDTVTIRERDSMEQKRIPIRAITDEVALSLNQTEVLKRL